MDKIQPGYIIITVVLLLVFLLVYRSEYPKFGLGATIPSMTIQLRDGNELSLTDLRGKYVLIHFWGSWCGPCRREIPELKALYDTFGNQNFEIVSIGIEYDSSDWESAIELLGMRWRYHTSDFQLFDSPLAQAFNVRQIPTTFLINPEGKVVGFNLPHKKIEQFLSER